MKDFFTAIDGFEIFNATMVLFAVIDIIGSIPIIIKVKETSGDIHAGRITIVSLIIMVSFLVMGESILGLFGVNISSFAVAGSLILFALAIEMSTGIQLFKESPDPKVSGKSTSIVPIAFPIIAGAGTMTTLVSIRAEYEMINILIAIVINMALVFVVLRLTRRIERLLGPGGIAIIKKVFGIILLAIAVKLFATNITVLFQ
ncbi:MAG: MarC family protein [Brumimicrobium sp.]|nr:MarC family protein [Brumimicrobium sp.]MCO5268064.1 MarC family protein [Brumimicrobium sp.]